MDKTSSVARWVPKERERKSRDEKNSFILSKKRRNKHCRVHSMIPLRSKAFLDKFGLSFISGLEFVQTFRRHPLVCIRAKKYERQKNSELKFAQI